MSGHGLVVDLFAGGGGASAGLEAALGRPVDVAVNHDATAIAVHERNHPQTRHLTDDVWKVDPREATGGEPVAVLWASPDCTHFSVAKGGKPRRKNIRSLAWRVVDWARDTRPAVIFLENVAEFRGWGPLDRQGHPIRAKKGFEFNRWKRALERLGYEVDYRVLDASLYGAPTKRKRLFLVARRDGLPIQWPAPTHGPGRLPLHTAAECIDWSIPCQSIFERKRPLAEKTLWRIAEGLRRFVLDNPEPYVVGVGGRAGQSSPTAASEPVGTVTAKNDRALLTPVLATIDQRGARQAETAAGEPLPVTVTKHRHALVAPTLVKFRHDAAGAAVDHPSPTITAGGNNAERPAAAGHALGLLTAYVSGLAHGEHAERPGLRSISPEEPLRTIHAGGNNHALVSPTLVKVNHGGNEARGESAEAPLSTVTASQRGHALIAPTLVQTGYGERPDLWRCGDCGFVYERSDLPTCGCSKCGSEEDMVLSPGQAPRALDLEAPIGTLVDGQKHGLVAAFLAKHFGDTGQRPGSDLDEPVATITASDHNAPVLASLVKLRGECTGAAAGEPLPTIAAQGNHVAEVRAFLTAFYGTDGTPGRGQRLGQPARTITARHRLGLVTIHGVDYQIVDIGMRMLEPHELLRAQFGRFAEGYDLSPARTKSAKVRLIGNSVCPEIAEAIVRANVAQRGHLVELAS